jgi:hypothetical protein
MKIILRHILVFGFILLWGIGLGSRIEAQQSTNSFSISGYSTFLGVLQFIPTSSPAYSQQHNPTFVQGAVNVYFNWPVFDQWRFFSELKFAYSPQGSPTIDDQYIDPTSGTTQNWNSVTIVRAFAEYSPFQLFKIRAGQYLTPFGIWNEDHGDPILTSITLPYTVRIASFAPSQTGLESYGSWFPTPENSISYALYTGNGEGDSSNTYNPDGHFSFGGRLQYEFSDLFLLNVSYYHGHVTNTDSVTVGYSKDVYGAGVKLSWAHAVIQAEVIQEQAFNISNYHDFTQSFFYVQAEYTLAEFITPYVRYEINNVDLAPIGSNSEATTLEPTVYTAGVNLHVNRNVILKLEYVLYDGVGSDLQSSLSSALSVSF